MGSPEEDAIVRQQVASSLPGTVLTITPPRSVNVEVPLGGHCCVREFERVIHSVGGNGGGLPRVSERDRQTGLASRVIVPVTCQPRFSEWHSRAIRGDRDAGYPPSKVQVRDHIRCELGFAVTIHKAGELPGGCQLFNFH